MEVPYNLSKIQSNLKKKMGQAMIFLRPKLPYRSIYELIKINCQRNDTFKMLKCFS